MPYISIPSITITITSASATSLGCTTTAGLYLGQQGQAVKSDGSGSIQVIISRIIDTQHFLCQSLANQNNSGGVDLSLYNGGSIIFEKQDVKTDYNASVVLPYVPSVNSTDNTYTNDVVGNKSDTGAGNSIYSLAYSEGKHTHSVAKVYPTLAAGATITKSATPWTLGSYAIVVPASTITSPFDIHSINFDAVSLAGVYEIVLYSGADGAEVEVGRTRFTRPTGFVSETDSVFQTPVIAANSQIKAKLAGSNSSASTATISLRYHTY